MIKGYTKRISVFAFLLLSSGATQAALIDRGGGFIYDDVLNITWTQNASINGADDWAGQVAWAHSLSLFDPVRGVTWSDWRLPSTDVDSNDTIVSCASSTEAQCRDNEYGYLYHQYGIRASAPGPFTNVQSSWYWSGTEYRPNLSGAWVFYFFGGGTQAGGDKTGDYYAWAVRDGDVAAGALDADSDGIADVNDNCMLVANGNALPDAGGLIQYDSNADGFGNICDPDLDDNGVVNFLDYTIMTAAFGSAPGNTNWNADADMNGDNIVNFIDIALFPPFFGSVPGPSGLVP